MPLLDDANLDRVHPRGTKQRHKGVEYVIPSGTGATIEFWTRVENSQEDPIPYWLFSGFFELDNNAKPGTITIQITDKDNILGAGSDYVLETFVDEVRISPGKEIKLYPPSTTDMVSAGLYLKLLYTPKTELSSNAKIEGTIVYYS